MSDSVFAALIGAITAIITSVIATWVSFRSIRTEYKTKYHLELITKQIQACENLWKTLAITSRTIGEQRLIVINDKDATIYVNHARLLYSDLIDVFNSSFGLYFSRNLRQALFDLRNFLGQEIILSTKQEITLQWSKTKASELDGYVQNLRNAIRQEIGLEDLTVTKSNRPG